MRLNRRYGFFFIPLFIAIVGFIAAWPNLERAEWFIEFCGVERWSVKTGTDADAGSVNLNAPQPNTIATMVGWPAQANPPANNRVSPYETNVWVINATLVEYKAESDEDYHLVLSDGAGHTMIAEIPAPHCVGSGSPFLAGITSARSKFDAKFHATGSFQTANVPVQITGVGMFDFPHGQTGAPPNQIELHPVINIVFAPSVPTGLTATAGNAQITLNWTAGSGAAAYNLYRSNSTGTETSYKTGLTSTSYTDTGLTNGATYFYKVTSVNGAGESAKSNEANATPAGPGAISGRIALEGVPDLSATNAASPPGALQILFRTPGTLTTLYTSNATITPIGAGSPFGTYTSNSVPAGTYDIALKTGKNLRVVKPSVTIFGPTMLTDTTLHAGDANNDNTVDVSDFSVLVNAYGGLASDPASGYLPNADLNADGSIDVVDFSLLVNNYGSMGDP